MEIKKIDGEEYILKSSVDELVRKRLSPMSERARKAEATILELQEKIDSSSDSSTKLQEQLERISKLETEIAQSRSQYESHSTIAQHGFIDPSLRDMVEWTYKREMESRPKKSQQKLGEWLAEIKENPDLAPMAIRPHLITTSPTEAAQPTETKPQHLDAGGSSSSAPPVNNQVVQHNGQISANLLDNALRDPEMYRAKRDEIKATWYAQRNKKPFM